MRLPCSIVLGLAALGCTAQSDRIKVYFNQDTDPTVSTGTLAIALHNAMDDTIEAYIDRALYSIDVAVYNANDLSIIYALNDAHDRGVLVRYIAEGSNSNDALAVLDPAIGLLYRTDGEGSGMHNKFMSIDAGDPARAWVWTGSTNWTQNGLFDDYNNMVFIQDQALAQAYHTEFEEMWGGTGAQPNAVNSRFGAEKSNDTPHYFTVDGVAIECWFSPSDGTTAHIVEAIEGAQHNVRSAMFSFTNDDIADALLAADQDPDISVHMDLEEAIYPGTEGWYLFSNGVDVVTHNSDDLQLHHKYGIVDEGSTDDPLVITGSHNWTWNAETVNDENTLVIHDATVANLFYQEWSARRGDVVSVAERTGKAGMNVWPIPVADRLHVQLPPGSDDARLVLRDVLGNEVMRNKEHGPVRTVDVSHLPEGNYALMCSGAGLHEVRAIVIAH